MTIWEVYSASKGFWKLDIDEKTFFDVFQFYHFDGIPLKEKWKPIKAALWTKDIKGNPLTPTIMPYLGRGYLAIANEYLPALDDLCKGAYEKLELCCDNGNYTLINIINPIDCLDLEHMSFRVYKGAPEEIQTIYHFAFLKEKINRPIFKIKNYAVGHIFCTDAFKRAMENMEVAGLVFEKVWTME